MKSFRMCLACLLALVCAMSLLPSGSAMAAAARSEAGETVSADEETETEKASAEIAASETVSESQSPQETGQLQEGEESVTASETDETAAAETETESSEDEETLLTLAAYDDSPYRLDIPTDAVEAQYRDGEQVVMSYMAFPSDNIQSISHVNYLVLRDNASGKWHTGYCAWHEAEVLNHAPYARGENRSSLNATARKMMGVALHYGFSSPSEGSGENPIMPTAEEKSKYAATQIMIWLAEHMGCSGYENLVPSADVDCVNKQDRMTKIASEVLAYAPQPQTAMNTFKFIRKKMAEQFLLPSFLSADPGRRETHAMTYDEKTGQYSCTLEDKNGVSGNFSYQAEGLTVTRDGAKITVTFKGPGFEGTKLVTGSRNDVVSGNDGMIFHRYIGDWDEDNVQDVIIKAEPAKTVSLSGTVAFTAAPLKGSLSLVKASSLPALTDGLHNYSLKGVQYTLYKDQGMKEKAGLFTIGEDGRSNRLSGLMPGVYYLKETKGSDDGHYPADPAFKKEVTIEGSGSEKVMDVKDVPAVADAALCIYKLDQETGKAVPPGSGSLEGAVFSVSYYDGDYDSLSDLPYEALRTWKIRTIAEKKGKDTVYAARLDKAHLVDGDEFFTAEGKTVLPCGTLRIREIKAPKGYKLKGSVISGADGKKSQNGDYLLKLQADQGQVLAEGGFILKAADQPVRGTLRFMKKDAATGKIMAGIPFMIRSMADDSSFRVVTDKKGCYSSEADKDHPSLPYGSYSLQELSCEANHGKVLYQGTFTIDKDGAEVDLGEIKNENIIIGTRARAEATGSHSLPAEAEAVVTDTVAFRGLKAGKTYHLTGTLVDKNTGEAVLDPSGKAVTAEKEFTAKSADGTAVVTFSFDASLLAGRTIVCFETLYKEGKEIAVHADLEDENQTLYVPRIMTHAYDEKTGTHNALAQGTARILDRVDYENLEKGQSYRMTGRVCDPETHKEILKDGKPVVSELTFEAEDRSGYVTMVFDLPADELAGRCVVILEQLWLEDKLIAAHEVYDDHEQQISFPDLHTEALDADSKSHEGVRKGKTMIRDTVTYSHLAPGSYKVRGRLMDPDTGKALLIDGKEVTAETDLVVDDAGDGQVILEFCFDASKMTGEKVVVFERLMQEETLIALHEDLKDDDQTVTYKKKTDKPGTPATGDGFDLRLMTLLLAAAMAACLTAGRILRRAD